jgi:hypothetical protein
MSNYFYDNIIPNYNTGTKSIKIDPTPSNPVITITDGTTTNTLTQSDWTGLIKTVNTSANSTHYLNFSDNATTGQGHPQKTAGISCNPSTNTVTATTFVGALTGASSLVTTTNNNTDATNFITFVGNNGLAGLRVDSVTGPLTYNPSSGTVTASIFSGSLSGNATTSSSAVGVNLTSDDTSGSYFLPFSKTTTASGNALFIDNSVTPLSYNPSTSRLACTEFSGNLLGNATTATNATTSSNIALTSDNTSGGYFIPFSKTTTSSNVLYVDDVSGPLTYNPSTGDMSITSVTAVTLTASTVNAELRSSSGTTPNATFAGTTLTINCNNVTLRTNTIIFTGAANTVAILSVSSPRNNGIYYVAIRNNGSLATSFLTGLGANILTKYSATVVVPASSSALMSINIITLNAVQTTIVGIDLLT